MGVRTERATRRAAAGGRAWSRAALVLAVLLAALGGPLPARAEQMDEAAYAAWVGDHGLRLFVTMQLPSQFTLGDLRDLAIELGQLVDQGRVIQPPPRYAA